MSASRDKSQKFTFVYSNLYRIYRDGKDARPGSESLAAAKAAVAARPGLTTSGKVLKAEDVASSASKARVQDYTPVGLLHRSGRGAQRVVKPEVLRTRSEAPAASVARSSANDASSSGSGLVGAHRSGNEAIRSLRENLQSLNRLHERLRFMLTELEELVKDGGEKK